MDNLDILLNIAIRTNYYAINSLICICKYYSAYPNIWELACQTKFPNKLYFDFWTGKENYLVHEREIFSLMINFHSRDVSNYMYEYDPVLHEILDLGYCSMPNMDHRFSHLLEFSIESQFIIVVKDSNSDTLRYKYHHTYQEAYHDIYKIKLRFFPKPDEIEFETAEIVIINLADCKPYFWKITKDIQRENCTYHPIFYRRQYISESNIDIVPYT